MPATFGSDEYYAVTRQKARRSAATPTTRQPSSLRATS
jgi:hypothetical protein